MQTLPPGVPSGYGMASAGAARATVTWEHLRCVCLALVLCLLWLVPNPNATSMSEDPTAGASGTILAQVLWIGLLLFGLLATNQRLHMVARQLDLSMVALFGWCALTTIYALVPDVSFRRLILTIVCVTIFCLLFSGIATLRNVVLVLLAMCILETVTKFVVVFAFPGFGRHPAVGPEPQLAGLWRGQYYHKNVAGPVCAIELAVIYACRGKVPGFILVPLALLEAVFLIFSGSKTPLFLFGGVVILTKFLVSLRSFPAIFATVFGAAAFLNFVTLASLFSDDAKDLAAALIGDVTFTGRIELWRFLLNYMQNHPFIGAGFQSFWQIGDLSPAVTEGTSWVTAAVYGHQGFLDTAVMIGIPGLILTLIFVIARPAADLAAIVRRRDPVLEMFVMFWLFGLLENGTESVLLARADSSWLFLVGGVVGLRRLRIEPELTSQGNPSFSKKSKKLQYTDTQHHQ